MTFQPIIQSTKITNLSSLIQNLFSYLFYHHTIIYLYSTYPTFQTSPKITILIHLILLLPFNYLLLLLLQLHPLKATFPTSFHTSSDISNLIILFSTFSFSFIPSYFNPSSLNTHHLETLLYPLHHYTRRTTSFFHLSYPISYYPTTNIHFNTFLLHIFYLTPTIIDDSTVLINTLSQTINFHLHYTFTSYHNLYSLITNTNHNLIYPITAINSHFLQLPPSYHQQPFPYRTTTITLHMPLSTYTYSNITPILHSILLHFLPHNKLPSFLIFSTQHKSYLHIPYTLSLDYIHISQSYSQHPQTPCSTLFQYIFPYFKSISPQHYHTFLCNLNSYYFTTPHMYLSNLTVTLSIHTLLYLSPTYQSFFRSMKHPYSNIPLLSDLQLQLQSHHNSLFPTLLQFYISLLHAQLPIN